MNYKRRRKEEGSRMIEDPYKYWASVRMPLTKRSSGPTGTGEKIPSGPESGDKKPPGKCRRSTQPTSRSKTRRKRRQTRAVTAAKAVRGYGSQGGYAAGYYDPSALPPAAELWQPDRRPVSAGSVPVSALRALSGGAEYTEQLYRPGRRWYYLSALANDGLGNQVTALEHIRRAVSMDPATRNTWTL